MSRRDSGSPKRPGNAGVQIGKTGARAAGHAPSPPARPPRPGQPKPAHLKLLQPKAVQAKAASPQTGRHAPPPRPNAAGSVQPKAAAPQVRMPAPPPTRYGRGAAQPKSLPGGPAVHAPPPFAPLRSLPGGPGHATSIQGYFAAGGPRLPGGRAIQPKGTGPARPSPNATPLPPNFSLSTAGGRPLPQAIQRHMEGFFRADFSDVRVHVGPEAAGIGALAFTIGNAIYFAPGQYQPETARGRQILGHELAHVIQQRAGRVRNPLGSAIAIVQDPILEAEADRMGAMAASAHHAFAPNGPAQPRMAFRPQAVQRMIAEDDEMQDALSDDEDDEYVPGAEDFAMEDEDFSIEQEYITDTEEEIKTDADELRKTHFFHQHVGYQFEEAEDAKIIDSEPGNTQTIDMYDKQTGVAVSLKTFNLLYNYQGEDGIGRLNKALKKYFDKLVNFKSVKCNGNTISALKSAKKNKVTSLILRLAVPSANRYLEAMGEIRRFRAENTGKSNAYNSSVKVTIEIVGFRANWIEPTGYLFEATENASIHGKEPGNFPTFDSLEKKKNDLGKEERWLVSLKTMDLMRNYRLMNGEANVNALYLKLKGFLDDMNLFVGRTKNGIEVTSDDYDIKVLRVLVPEHCYAEYEQAFIDAADYASKLKRVGIKGVKKKFKFEVRKTEVEPVNIPIPRK